MFVAALLLGLLTLSSQAIGQALTNMDVYSALRPGDVIVYKETAFQGRNLLSERYRHILYEFQGWTQNSEGEMWRGSFIVSNVTIVDNTCSSDAFYIVKLNDYACDTIPTELDMKAPYKPIHNKGFEMKGDTLIEWRTMSVDLNRVFHYCKAEFGIQVSMGMRNKGELMTIRSYQGQNQSAEFMSQQVFFQSKDNLTAYPDDYIYIENCDFSFTMKSGNAINIGDEIVVEHQISSNNKKCALYSSDNILREEITVNNVWQDDKGLYLDVVSNYHTFDSLNILRAFLTKETTLMFPSQTKIQDLINFFTNKQAFNVMSTEIPSHPVLFSTVSNCAPSVNTSHSNNTFLISQVVNYAVMKKGDCRLNEKREIELITNKF